MKAKRTLLVVAAVVTVSVSAVAGFAGFETAAYDASVDKVYEVPLKPVSRSNDLAVLARGQHVVDAIAGCSSASCHGADLGGGETVRMGPAGRSTGTNITSGGLGRDYTDAELARLIREGIKRDGRTVRFMPVQDFRWLPEDDVDAAISYLRAAPPVLRENGPTEFTVLGKVLDRQDRLVIDVARRLDHRSTRPRPPPSSPSSEYGAYLAKSCTGCHGEHLSGGPIPGAPNSMPVPLNLTASGDGLSRWTYGDFDRAVSLGVKPDGQRLDPFMPRSTLDDSEKRALWAYLKTAPPRRFGQR